MIKSLLSSALYAFALGVALAHADSLIVNRPWSGFVWKSGESVTIDIGYTKTDGGVSAIDVDLVRGGPMSLKLAAPIASGLTAKSQTVTFIVPASLETGPDYSVRVQSSKGSAQVVNYSASFTVQSSGSGSTNTTNSGNGNSATPFINGANKLSTGAGNADGSALLKNPSFLGMLLTDNNTDANFTKTLKQIVLKNLPCLTNGTDCPEEERQMTDDASAVSVSMSLMAAVAGAVALAL
jgi:hypothetical protein